MTFKHFYIFILSRIWLSWLLTLPFMMSVSTRSRQKQFPDFFKRYIFSFFNMHDIRFYTCRMIQNILLVLYIYVISIFILKFVNYLEGSQGITNWPAFIKQVELKHISVLYNIPEPEGLFISNSFLHFEHFILIQKLVVSQIINCG